MKGVFRRDGGTILPIGHTAREAVLGLPDNRPFMGEFWTARNPKHHDLYWSLVTLAAEAWDMDKETMHDLVMQKLHMGQWLTDDAGVRKFYRDSIAFESMEQARFAAVFKQAAEALAILVGARRADLLDRFNDLMKGSMP